MRSAQTSARSAERVNAFRSGRPRHQVRGERDLVGAGDEEASAVQFAQRVGLALLEGIDRPDQRIHLGRRERVLQHEEPVLVVLPRLLRRDGAEGTRVFAPAERGVALVRGRVRPRSLAAEHRVAHFCGGAHGPRRSRPCRAAWSAPRIRAPWPGEPPRPGRAAAWPGWSGRPGVPPRPTRPRTRWRRPAGRPRRPGDRTGRVPSACSPRTRRPLSNRSAAAWRPTAAGSVTVSAKP